MTLESYKATVKRQHDIIRNLYRTIRNLRLALGALLAAETIEQFAEARRQARHLLEKKP